MIIDEIICVKKWKKPLIIKTISKDELKKFANQFILFECRKKGFK
jgi:hypothetical protein